ncbi:MAG: hypothetical protein ACRENE_12815, partial [Polyangiaceae bacterium]
APAATRVDGTGAGDALAEGASGDAGAGAETGADAPADASAADDGDADGEAADAGDGGPIVFAAGLHSPTGITLSSTNVYWGSQADGVIMFCPKTGCPGGQPSTIVTGQGGIVGLSYAPSGFLYWATTESPDGAQGAMVMRECVTPFCGSPMPTLPTPYTQPSAAAGVAVNSDRIYATQWSSLESCSLLYGCTLDGGMLQSEFNTSCGIQGVALGPSRVYITHWGCQTVTSCPLGVPCPSGQEVVLASAVLAPLHVAVDDTSVYFTQFDARVSTRPYTGPASLDACPLAGCGGQPPVKLATGGGPWGVAVDDTYVYYTDYLGGTVQRIPKVRSWPAPADASTDGP